MDENRVPFVALISLRKDGNKQSSPGIRTRASAVRVGCVNHDTTICRYAEIPEQIVCHQSIPGLTHIPSFQTPRPTIFSAPPRPNTRPHPSNTWTRQIPLIKSRVPSVALLPHPPPPPFPLNQAFHLCLSFPHIGFQQNVSMIAHSNPRGSPTSNRSTHRHSENHTHL